MLRRVVIISLILLLILSAIGGAVGFWGWNYITRDLPDFENVEDYRPAAVSTVLAADGTRVAEFFDERRYPIKLAEVPKIVRQAFLAAEDANFYNHPGIDPISIARAVVKNFKAGSASQGGSTITQQVVKNLLLSPEKKLLRKAKEAILSYRLEKRLSKDDILEIYLNQIFFGNKAYGLKAAARAYYRKEVSELTLAEAAMLAALPKAPSSYSPLAHRAKAKGRQGYVLDQMVKAGFITNEERRKASAEEIQFYRATETNLFSAPYYISEVRRLLVERRRDLSIDRDGLVIHTALDLGAQANAERGLMLGLREVDKRRGWRGPVKRGVNIAAFEAEYGRGPKIAIEQVYPALVTGVARSAITVALGGGVTGVLDLKSAGWAKKRLASGDRVSFISGVESELKVGDVVEVAAKIEQPKPTPKKGPAAHKQESPSQVLGVVPGVFTLDQTPDIEGAITILDPHSGKVTAVVGGYSYQRNQFNRVTQSYRQPGSTFKPMVYLAAVDGYGYTPSTIVHDSPRTFQVGDESWTPGNYDGKFLGAIPLQVALERSRNLVSVDIVSKIGLDAVISYAKRLGIESKIGRNPSISLGSSEVTLLELSRAYGVFAAKGVLYPSVMITKIEDRFGKVIFDQSTSSLASATQAISEESAFIMAHMMEGVVQRGTGYKVKELNRAVAGKTGTSNDQMDTWFIGYTPSWVCGVWVGFDQKKEIGDKETGGRVAAPIFVYAMDSFLKAKDSEQYDLLTRSAREDSDRLGIEYVSPPPVEPEVFSVPAGVEPFWVNKNTGVLSEAGAPDAILEYFKRGTEPPKVMESSGDEEEYYESPEL